jgi:ribosomal protein S19E (S16A)
MEKSSFCEILHDAKTQCAEAITKVNDALFQERDALKASRKFSILETQNSKEWRPIKDNIAASRYVSIMRRYSNEALLTLFARLFPQ